MNARRLVPLLLAGAVFARGESSLEITVRQIPPRTAALIFVIDTIAPAEGPGYDDGQPAPPAAAPADPVAAAAAGQTPQRRRRSLNPAKPPAAVRTEMKLSAPADTITWRTAAPTGDNIRVRVAAVDSDGTFPRVAASGKATAPRTNADAVTPVAITLVEPSLKLAGDTPTTVAPGATFVLAGTITDSGSFLGLKNRMRVWLSPGVPPSADRAGTQISTIDVTTKGDEVAFAFELVAPSEPSVLYYQFGELSGDFARVDGTQAPFVMLPSVTVAPVRSLKIQRPAATALAGEK